MSHNDASATRRTALKLISGATVGATGIGSVSAADDRFADREYDDDISEWVLRLGTATDLTPADADVDVDSLKSRAARAQKRVVDQLAERPATVRQQTWVVNAILVESTELGPRDLVEVDGVVDVHPNFTVESPEPVGVKQLVPLPEATNPTYGLDQIDAPQVWEQFETQGAGARVAVLDTGIDTSHPDLTLAEDGWAQFDAEGNQLDTEPNDPEGHGTHVSGTVAGGAASGLDIGVAPDVELLHAKVLDGGGTFIQIAAGIQWAVEQEADVVNMSLGATGFFGAMIEPVRSALAAGTLIISSSGNSGAETSGSPGNVYDSVAVGATDRTGAVTSFSSGERIHTPTAWDNENTEQDPPDDWPTWYTVPNLSAPGNNVISAYPGGSWQQLSGTSMASPHVAGAAGLIQSLNSDLGPTVIQQLLQLETVHPDGRQSPDIRYGRGILNVFNAATRQVHDGTITGTVSIGGEPAPGIAVETEFGTRQITDEDGQYALPHPEATALVAANTFGLSTGLREVSVAGTIEQNLELEQIVDFRLRQGQPPDIADGDSFDIELDVANLEELTISLADASTGVPAEAVTFTLDGQSFGIDEPVTFSEPLSAEGVTLTATVEGADDGATLALTHTFRGLGEGRAADTGPTTVRVDPLAASVQIVEPNFQQTVGPNGTLTFNPTLENPGELTAAERVQMVIENVDTGEEVINTSFPVDVELSPGERRPVSLPIGFGDFPRQEATQRIVTPNDEASSTLEILNSELVFPSENVPTTGTTGFDVVVSVTVQNNGEVEGTTTLSYSFDDVTVDQTTVSVAGGESTTVELSTETDGLAPGQYPHQISAESQTLIQDTITLEQPDLHDSGVPIEVADAILPNGADTTLGVIRSAVDDWTDDRRIGGVPVTLGQLRVVINWWSSNR